MRTARSGLGLSLAVSLIGVAFGATLLGCGLGGEGTMLFVPPPAPAPTMTGAQPPGTGAPDAGSADAATGTTTTDAGAPTTDAGSPGAPDASPPQADAGTTADGASAPPPAPAPPTLLANDFGAGEFVAVASGHAYWTTGSGNTVLTCALTGTAAGCAASVATLGSGMTTYGIAVDTANVYWTDYGDGLACECPLAGCNGTTILDGQGVRGDGLWLAADSVFWTFETDGSGAAGTGALFMSATDGTSTTPVITGQNFPIGLVIAGADAYWAVFGDGIIRTCTWANCAATVKDLVTGMTGPSYLAVDAAHLYWTNAGTAPDYGNGSVMQANLDGTSVVTLASGMTYARGIAIDTASVYFTNYVGKGATSGSVLRCAIGGCAGTPTVLATAQASPVGIAVDATNVYWVDEGGGGALMMTAK